MSLAVSHRHDAQPIMPSQLRRKSRNETVSKVNSVVTLMMMMTIKVKMIHT